jgi:hypothetical protein
VACLRVCLGKTRCSSSAAAAAAGTSSPCWKYSDERGTDASNIMHMHHDWTASCQSCSMRPNGQPSHSSRRKQVLCPPPWTGWSQAAMPELAYGLGRTAAAVTASAPPPLRSSCRAGGKLGSATAVVCRLRCFGLAAAPRVVNHAVAHSSSDSVPGSLPLQSCQPDTLPPPLPTSPALLPAAPCLQPPLRARSMCARAWAWASCA